MRLSDVLTEDAVVLGLEGLDKWAVITRLTDQMVESGQAQPDWREGILKGLIEREKQSSTGMQDGFAIPHCRMDEPVATTLVTLAVLRDGLDFEAIDGRETRLVVCLVTPRQQNREHLRILAGIAQLFASKDFRGALVAAETPAEVVAAIRTQEKQLPS